MSTKPEYFNTISSLGDSTLYDAVSIVQTATNKGFIGDDKKSKDDFSSALYTMKSRNLSRIFEGADGTLPDRVGKDKEAFYGWRWRLAYSAFRNDKDARALHMRAGLGVPFEFLKKPWFPAWVDLVAVLSRIRQSSRRTLAMWSLGFVVLFACGTAVTSTDFYKIVREHGAKAALKQMLAEQPDTSKATPETLYHRAYLMYRTGQLEASKSLIPRLAGSEDLWMQGKTSYLLGLIGVAQGNKAESESHFSAAIDAFEEYKPSRNLFLARVELGLLVSDASLLQEASRFLGTQTGSPSFWDDSYILYSAKRHMFSTQDDYGRATKYGVLAVEAARKSGNVTYLAWALNDMAIVYGYYREPGKALPLFRESLSMNRVLNISALHHKGLIAEGFLRKCGNQDEFDIIVSEITKYIEGRPGQILGDDLRELIEWSCNND